MLSDVMDYFDLGREFDQAGYFDTEHQRYLVKEITAAIMKGRIIALAGIVGCGKTKLLQHLRSTLKQGKAVAVARSLAVDKARVNLAVLMRAMAYDLATDEKALSLPKQPEDREHRVVELIAKHKKPAVLVVDDAHDLHGSTLAGLKRLIEIVGRSRCAADVGSTILSRPSDFQAAVDDGFNERDYRHEPRSRTSSIQGAIPEATRGPGVSRDASKDDQRVLARSAPRGGVRQALP
jgi:energy-coupling factor transporter ATP-binding protein EcfA2